VFETSELQDDVFSPLNNNIKTSRTRHSRRSELLKRSSSDFSDAELFETTEVTNLDMFLTPSPNGETRHPLRDMSSPTSIASRSSTATFPGSRTGTPMMDQTLSAAFRDKIKIRLQSAKHRAKRRSFREELQEKQEYELNEEVETRLSSRSDWKQNIEKVLDSQIEELNDLKVSREEAYDFFVKTDWDVSKEGNKKVKDSIVSVPKTQPEGEEVIQVEEEDSRLLVKDIFTTTENWKLYERSKSFFRTRKERIAEEEKLLFIPSNEAMDKLTELQAEEDGLYIEKTKSIVSSKNLNKLKNRIISEGLKEKFIDDSQAFIINNVDSEVKYSVLISPDLRSDEELVTRFRPCRLEETFQISSDMKYELIVKVKSLTFTNHPFFSEEHALAQKLVEYFDIYKEIKEKIPIVSQKLQSLFITAKNLNSETFADEVDVNKCERIQLNKSLLMETYNERNEKVRKVRNILLQLLSTWDQLQRIRDIQNYAITNVKLVCFEDSDVNINKEKKMWDELVGEGLELEKYLFKENDERAQEEYRRDLRIWKQWQRTKRRMSNKSEIDENIDQMEEKAEPLKPEPPTLSFDETKALDRIRNNTLLIDGRLPGEPKFSKITLETSEINVKLKDLPKSEQRRRNELMRRKYCIQFFVNDQPFGQTNDKESNFNFVIHWNQLFKIDVKNSSSKLRIRINEKQNLSANHLADLFIPLPDGLTNINNSVPLKLEFASNKNSSDYSKQSIISGFIDLMVYWEMDSEGVVLCPPDLALNNKNESEQLKNLETLNLDDLKQWIQHLSTQDPNDPNNVNLIETLKNYKELLESNENFQKCFRLDPLMKEFEFVTDEEIENNPRFRLLQNRWQGIPNFKGYRFVPLNEKEIPLSLFEKKVRIENIPKSKRGFEDKRQKAIKILTKVREQLIRQSRGTFDRPRTLEDMVIEEEVPSIR
jgi:coiled-coil and C2 domain-containing protein 2A